MYQCVSSQFPGLFLFFATFPELAVRRGSRSEDPIYIHKKIAEEDKRLSSYRKSQRILGQWGQLPVRIPYICRAELDGGELFLGRFNFGASPLCAARRLTGRACRTVASSRLTLRAGVPNHDLIS